MDFIRLLFSEGSDVSSMRIMSFMSLLIGGYIAIYGMYKNMDLAELAILSSVFVGAAFGGKIMQKIQEVKTNEEGNNKVRQD